MLHDALANAGMPATGPFPAPGEGFAAPGFPARNGFLQSLDAAVRLAGRQKCCFAVLLVDAGLASEVEPPDAARVEAAAAAIRGTVRFSDTVAFLNGGEFAVLLNVGNAEGAQRVAGKIAHALGNGMPASREVAIGIAMFPAHGGLGEALLRAAEGALFQARRSHQGVVMAPQAASPRDPEVTLEERVGAALAQDEFMLHFQPVVRLVSGLPVSAEALARWHHPERGLLPPAEFLPVAEGDGACVELSLRLVDHALAQVRAWRDRGLALSLSLNMTTAMLDREGVDLIILGCLHGLALAPDCLSIELRDENLTRLSPVATKSLFGLATAGVGLSIDEFGGGAGSLFALRDLPVQEFKISAAFVSQVCRSEADAAIVAALVTLGRKLGKTVIAKGIEREDVRQKLCELGCEYGQGFLFAPGLGAEDLERWWSSRRQAN